MNDGDRNVAVSRPPSLDVRVCSAASDNDFRRRLGTGLCNVGKEANYPISAWNREVIKDDRFAIRTVNDRQRVQSVAAAQQRSSKSGYGQTDRKVHSAILPPRRTKRMSEK